VFVVVVLSDIFQKMGAQMNFAGDPAVWGRPYGLEMMRSKMEIGKNVPPKKLRCKSVKKTSEILQIMTAGQARTFSLLCVAICMDNTTNCDWTRH